MTDNREFKLFKIFYDENNAPVMVESVDGPWVSAFDAHKEIFRLKEELQKADERCAAERERCAALARLVGDEYGDDEAGWSECSETIAAEILKGDAE